MHGVFHVARSPAFAPDQFGGQHDGTAWLPGQRFEQQVHQGAAGLAAMREDGYAYAIIGGPGPAEFYAKAVGATPEQAANIIAAEQKADAQLIDDRARALAQLEAAE